MARRYPSALLLTAFLSAVLCACGTPTAGPLPTATPVPPSPTPTATAAPAPGEPVTVTLTPSRDTTLYEDPTRLENSNARGQRFFAGVTAKGFARRALIAFGVSATIPAGATVLSVELVLGLSKTGTNDGVEVALHRLTAGWGEGTSRALGEEGGGTLATEGDATWVYRSFQTEQWATAGGDFVEEASGSTSVAGTGEYVWHSTPGMVADVQAWLDSPPDNHGWLLKAAETGSRTAKRFDGKDHAQEANRPRMVVRYVVPVP